VASSGPADRTARRGYGFPLLLFGALAALALPLSVLASPRVPTGVAVLIREVYPTVTQAMYFGGGSATGPFPFPQGWYWVGVLVAGLLVTAAWYRWRDRRTGGWAARQSRSRARGRRSWTAVNRGCGAGEFAGRGRSYV
jgi:hypothetical protein